MKHEMHGMKYTSEYDAYSRAKSRCNNPKHRLYAYYGGRGIEFRFQSFEEFYAHVGRRPSRLYSLDRIDNDGHYENGNIQWATKQQQSQNRRTAVLTLDRKREIRAYLAQGHTQREAANRFNVSKGTVYNAL